mmetsp:Transcript_27017/g.44895  ORF Transcript_27017/g.44895 Transcript_27017/m.44895 type:complete len:267 (+) Transcript_27017:430-1230(+)
MSPAASPVWSASVKRIAACCNCGVFRVSVTVSGISVPVGKCSASLSSIAASLCTPALMTSLTDTGGVAGGTMLPRMLDMAAAEKGPPPVAAVGVALAAVAAGTEGGRMVPRIFEMSAAEKAADAATAGVDSAAVTAAGAGAEASLGTAALAGAVTEAGTSVEAAGAVAVGGSADGELAAGAADAVVPESIAMSSEWVMPPKPSAAGAAAVCTLPLRTSLAFFISSCSLAMSSALSNPVPFLRGSCDQKKRRRPVVNSSNMTKPSLH